MSSPLPTQDQPLLGRLIGFVLRVFDAAAALFFASALLINFANVVGRYAFHSPIYWAEEVTIILIIWSVCLMSFKLTLHNEHLVTDILRPYLPERWQIVLAAVTTAWAVALSVFIAYYAFVVVQMVARMSQVTTVAEIPKSLAYSSILVCFVLVIIAAMLALIGIFNKKARTLIGHSVLDDAEAAAVARSL